MTNYERIKDMSVEEMVEVFFFNSKYCSSKEPKECKLECFIDGLSPCENCFKKWLESEVEEK